MLDTLKTGIEPFSHQKDALDRLIDNDGKIVLSHGTGTGKTATGIMGAELLAEKGKGSKVLVVVPSGLRENFASSGLARFLKNPSYQVVASSGEAGRENYARVDGLSPDKRYTIVGYEMFVRNHEQIMDKVQPDTMILDEFHKLRNESTGTFKAIAKARSRVKNFIGLTASPINNDPAELASLASIAEGRRIMTPSQFRSTFTRPKKDGGPKERAIKNKGRFAEFSDRRFDYADASSIRPGEMPKKDVAYVDVPMSDEQYKYHQMALKKLGPVRDYIERRNQDVIVKDYKPELIFAQLAHARQISNSIGAGRRMDTRKAAEETPKVRKLLDDTVEHLKTTPDGQVVLYSNLINGGVDVLSAGLAARGIDHSLFIGKGTELGGSKVTSQSRDMGVKDFNAGKKKVIVISGAGAEGLSLNNSTAFYALDGHFNPERIMQAEARAVRLGGQSHREPTNRRVDVRRYRSVAPPSKQPGVLMRALGSKPPRTVDEWVYSTAARKGAQNEQFRSVMKEPTKYVSKYRGPDGRWRYKYPPKDTRRSMFGHIANKFFGN